jgi:hypothetical protein
MPLKWDSPDLEMYQLAAQLLPKDSSVASLQVSVKVRPLVLSAEEDHPVLLMQA